MSVNKTFFIGHLGKDPEVKTIGNGIKVATFSMAMTERGYTKADGTAIPDSTQWANIVAWRGLAEIAERFLKKGSKIHVEAKYTSRSYDNEAGNKVYVTEFVANSIDMLDTKPSNNDTGNSSSYSHPSTPPPPKADLPF